MTLGFEGPGPSAPRAFGSHNVGASSTTNPQPASKVIDLAAQQPLRDITPLDPGNRRSFSEKAATQQMLSIDAVIAQAAESAPLVHTKPKSPHQSALLQKQGFAQPVAIVEGRGLGGDEEGAEALALSPVSESMGKEREEDSITPKPIRQGREREVILTTPKPGQAYAGFSGSQEDDKEVQLLVSTFEFSRCAQFAKQVCYNGPPGKWALFDKRDSEGVSLVTNVGSEVARKVFSYLTGKRLFMFKSKPLCVMYIEPRNGGEVLVKGMLMPNDPIGSGRPSAALIRRLSDFFKGFEM